MSPKVAEVALLVGLLRDVMLKTFAASARKPMLLMRSVMAKSFDREDASADW